MNLAMCLPIEISDVLDCIISMTIEVLNTNLTGFHDRMRLRQFKCINLRPG